MMKRTVCFFCALMICLGMIRVGCTAAAIDPSRSCSLTLSYTLNGIAFSDLQIDIYRVAELRSDGTYALVEPFSGYPIRIHGITSQQEWRETAQTIKNYAAANQIKTYRSQKTDDNGVVFFDGLQTGLYMVKGAVAQSGNETVAFYDFMVYLPTPKNGDYDYDIEAKPKCTQYTQPVKYTVVKLWKDSGASGSRPASVRVEILKDGAVQERVVLDGTNNWSHSWEAAENGAVWSVMEKDVPNGYQVSITENKTTFFITNTKSNPDPDDPDDPDTPDDPEPTVTPDDPEPTVTPDDPDPTVTPDDPEPTVTPDDPEPSVTPDEPQPDVPNTGDTTPVLLYVTLMCISGFGLMIFGMLGLRDRRNEKKQ